MEIITEGDCIYVFPLPPGVYDVFVKHQEIVQSSSYRSEIKPITRSLSGGNLILTVPINSNGFVLEGDIGNFKIEDVKKFVKAYNKEVGYVQHHGYLTVDYISKMDAPTVVQILSLFDLLAARKNLPFLIARWALLNILADEEEEYLTTHVKEVIKHSNFKDCMTCSDSVIVEKYRARNLPVFVPMNDFLRRYLLVVCDVIEEQETQRVTNKPFKKAWYENHRPYLEPLMRADSRLKEYFGFKGMSYKMSESRVFNVAKKLKFDVPEERSSENLKKTKKSSK